MTRHFLGLYVLIVLTLAAVSWGQDKLLQVYSNQDVPEDRSLVLAMAVLAHQLQSMPDSDRKALLARTAAESGFDMELFATMDITGSQTLDKLRRGEIALMSAGAESWVLKQIDAEHVLAFRSIEPESRRGALEWTLTSVFYAAIALVIMIWIWPLTRDLRSLERAAAQFGNRNWRFDATIKPHSQIYGLAETFRKMAARIEGLIASHKEMSNAVSHEIRTPLARMKFEIELAQQSKDLAEVSKALGNIKADITAISDLATATLDYAILERADMSLNIGTYDFTILIPAITEAVRNDTRADLHVVANVDRDADRVNCDVHQFEAILKNLLYNASRYAKHEIRVGFRTYDGRHHLSVDDDGPGIPEQDRKRAFESFVQLDKTRNKKTGFGLGLAIVKRAIEWHGGEVVILDSPLGGARFAVSWPADALP
jgi:two-component system OmpR family sensor kinase